MSNKTYEQIQAEKAIERDKMWNAMGVIRGLANRGLRRAVMPEQALSEILQVTTRYLKYVDDIPFTTPPTEPTYSPDEPGNYEVG